MDALLTILIPLLIQVESSGNANAFKASENAAGCLQIRPICLEDTNRILKLQKSEKRFTKKDRYDPMKAKEICRIYLSFYGKEYEKNTGKKADIYILSSMWCAGPDGYKQIKTNENVQRYIEKVKKAKEKINEQQAEEN